MDDTLGVSILVNAGNAPWRRSFDLAHELFHLVTWNIFPHEEIGDGTKKTKPEQHANIFASSLLLPQEHLIASLKEISSHQEIKMVDVTEIAKDFKVSSEAVLWRLVNLKYSKERWSRKSWKTRDSGIWIETCVGTSMRNINHPSFLDGISLLPADV
ncbi:MAG: hypothetical protein A2X96_11070 [Syntrophobacterales bacterium GWC2_56_13]|nr:MAG: hypothetical protein A2X96_11070 [Syntrophobacterales bacterium GWC2_56_13]